MFEIKPGLIYKLKHSSYTTFLSSKPILKNGNWSDLQQGDIFMILGTTTIAQFFDGKEQNWTLVIIACEDGLRWMLDTIFFGEGYDDIPLELLTFVSLKNDS